ncbi:hypothetical protein [Streptantibioticus ferralitis]|uniref:Uncharacterized protein n=1 Tax=Streptantibioticus ferralitis TaxID=236510 RepID=A0ABT5YWT4_9ACTN|nr:hypothetical protein [Streptantibioticus ferralitis]MDF2256041.1 hypothetical protein [Streptantibioticus ferralitis]
MPEVMQLSQKTASAEPSRTDAPQAAESRSSSHEEPRSLTPVFNALVRDWRAEGRDIPLRHKPAVSAPARGAAA